MWINVRNLTSFQFGHTGKFILDSYIAKSAVYISLYVNKTVFQNVFDLALWVNQFSYKSKSWRHDLRIRCATTRQVIKCKCNGVLLVSDCWQLVLSGILQAVKLIAFLSLLTKPRSFRICLPNNFKCFPLMFLLTKNLCNGSCCYGQPPKATEQCCGYPQNVIKWRSTKQLILKIYHLSNQINNFRFISYYRKASYFIFKSWWTHFQAPTMSSHLVLF